MSCLGSYMCDGGDAFMIERLVVHTGHLSCGGRDAWVWSLGSRSSRSGSMKEAAQVSGVFLAMEFKRPTASFNIYMSYNPHQDLISALTSPLTFFTDRTTPTGQIINQYLSSSATLPDQSIHLLFTANRWEAAPNIAALLAQGVTVVCDRYYYSGMVYSAAKGNPSLGLPWARAPEVGLPRPDAVVFLDLDEEKARERGGFGEERYETAEMQRRVRGLFWGLKKGDVGGVPFVEEAEDLLVVDAGGSIEEVAEEIWRVVRPKVEGVENGDLGREVRRVS